MELLGPSLQSKGGTVSTQSVLSDRTVGLYFSAHWCPPCRSFTPCLAKSYTTSLKSKGLEIVFVSFDQDEKAFEEYYSEMPWLAMPFSANRQKVTELSQKLNMRGIPTLIILDCDGSVIAADAKAQVMSDPAGANFPWKAVPKASAGINSISSLTEQSMKMQFGIMAITPLLTGSQGLYECFVGARSLPAVEESTCYWLLAHGSSCLLSSVVGITAALKWRRAVGLTEKTAVITKGMGPWLKIAKTLSAGLAVVGIWIYRRTEDDSRFWIRRSLCCSFFGPAVIGIVAAPVLALSRYIL